jgi:NAD(P)-dependent dehydrogenase (short-subunit alcohol dehydrogenase family)
MPSYVVIGASRGIGYAFLQQLALDPNNIIIGTARKAGTTREQVEKDGLKNVAIVEADLLSRENLKKAAAEVSKLTNGSLDYLVLNGAYQNIEISSIFLDEFDKEPEKLYEDLEVGWKTNVVGLIYAINAFLPLIKKGHAKKVVAISTGMADLDLITKYDIWEAPAYSIQKAALNTMIAKYAARYGWSEGILFMSVSPGFVNTGRARELFAPLMLRWETVG